MVAIQEDKDELSVLRQVHLGKFVVLGPEILQIDEVLYTAEAAYSFVVNDQIHYTLGTGGADASVESGVKTQVDQGLLEGWIGNLGQFNGSSVIISPALVVITNKGCRIIPGITG